MKDYINGKRGEDYERFKNRNRNIAEALEKHSPHKKLIDASYSSPPLTWRIIQGPGQAQPMAVLKDFNRPIECSFCREPKSPTCSDRQNINVTGFWWVTISSVITCGEIMRY